MALSENRKKQIETAFARTKRGLCATGRGLAWAGRKARNVVLHPYVATPVIASLAIYGGHETGAYVAFCAGAYWAGMGAGKFYEAKRGSVLLSGLTAGAAVGTILLAVVTGYNAISCSWEAKANARNGVLAGASTKTGMASRPNHMSRGFFVRKSQADLLCAGQDKKGQPIKILTIYNETEGDNETEGYILSTRPDGSTQWNKMSGKDLSRFNPVTCTSEPHL